MSAPRAFDCVAYGPVPREMGMGDLCFVEAVDGRCGSLGLCRARMAAERQRVYDRLHVLAASGEADADVFRDVLTEIEGPDDLLNADAPPSER